MTKAEKKELVLKKIEEGDKRSYNQLMADLELDIWSAKFKGLEIIKEKPNEEEDI